MVCFEKLKNWLVAGNKPGQYDGLDPFPARPEAFKPVSDGQMGFNFNTEKDAKFWQF